ncbi:hypothetical protein B0H13DRAFT_1906627 [Mycena leptocephala]|nr:hypothetical protein B0H13DRAFT_1906627 [Mycena leptocephala]
MLALPHLDLSTLKEKLLTLNAFDEDNEDVVNAAQGKSRSGVSQKKASCTNAVCPKPDTHSWPYCMSPGGGMAGHTVREAVNKYRADKGRAGNTASANAGTGLQRSKHVKHNAAGEALITLEGVDYRITPIVATPAPSPTTSTIPSPTANFAHLHDDTLPTANLRTDALPADLEAWAAIDVDDPHVSVDWNALVNLAMTVASAEMISPYLPILEPTSTSLRAETTSHVYGDRASSYPGIPRQRCERAGRRHHRH